MKSKDIEKTKRTDQKMHNRRAPASYFHLVINTKKLNLGTWSRHPILLDNDMWYQCQPFIWKGDALFNFYKKVLQKRVKCLGKMHENVNTGTHGRRRTRSKYRHSSTLARTLHCSSKLPPAYNGDFEGADKPVCWTVFWIHSVKVLLALWRKV